MTISSQNPYRLGRVFLKRLKNLLQKGELMLKEYFLIVILLFALFHDLRSRRIPNYLTFTAILLASIINSYTLGVAGLINSCYGILTGFVLLVFPFMMGGIGAGDVKLLMAIGAFSGPYLTFYVFLYAALVGGIYSFLLMAKHGELVPFLKKVYFTFFFFTAGAVTYRNLNVFNKEEKKLAIPYAVAIASGVMLSKWVRWF